MFCLPSKEGKHRLNRTYACLQRRGDHRLRWWVVLHHGVMISPKVKRNLCLRQMTLCVKNLPSRKIYDFPCHLPSKEGKTPLLLKENRKRTTHQKRRFFVIVFFYPLRSNGISSRFSVYIITVGVYHQPKAVSLRNDDMQSVALMTYNSLGIDDIHGFAVI